MNDDLLFYFEKLPVGYFEEEKYPASSGNYKYMPFRGPGHYNLQKALESGTNPKCCYHKNGYIHYFCVVSCPKYGELDLTEFSVPHEE